MSEHFNGLSPEEAERLAILIEECAEVQHIACKILRHGYDFGHPEKQEGVTNRDELTKEVGHLYVILDQIQRHNDISFVNVNKSFTEKIENINKWLHHTIVIKPTDLP
jgi:hypothetical protein